MYLVKQARVYLGSSTCVKLERNVARCLAIHAPKRAMSIPSPDVWEHIVSGGSIWACSSFSAGRHRSNALLVPYYHHLNRCQVSNNRTRNSAMVTAKSPRNSRRRAQVYDLLLSSQYLTQVAFGMTWIEQDHSYVFEMRGPQPRQISYTTVVPSYLVCDLIKIRKYYSLHSMLEVMSLVARKLQPCNPCNQE